MPKLSPEKFGGLKRPLLERFKAQTLPHQLNLIFQDFTFSNKKLLSYEDALKVSAQPFLFKDFSPSDNVANYVSVIDKYFQTDLVKGIHAEYMDTVDELVPCGLCSWYGDVILLSEHCIRAHLNTMHKFGVYLDIEATREDKTFYETMAEKRARRKACHARRQKRRQRHERRRARALRKKEEEAQSNEEE